MKTLKLNSHAVFFLFFRKLQILFYPWKTTQVGKFRRIYFSTRTAKASWFLPEDPGEGSRGVTVVNKEFYLKFFQFNSPVLSLRILLFIT
jgi:hypothetical protein